jgi:purine nucleosidase
VVELEGRHARGATIVDWRREEGRPDNVAILRRYDQVAFEARLASALAAGVGDD